MNHREAREHLLDLASGRIDGRELDALRGHVAECDDCRAWLEAHDSLNEALGPATDGEHPDSQLLALCAVRAEELFEPDRADLRSHLESCDRCRDEVDLVRAAVIEARPAAPRSTAPARSRDVSPRWMYAVAAGLAAVAIGTVLVRGVWRGQAYQAPPTDVASAAAAVPEAIGPELPPEEFSEAEIEGARLIETAGGLIISRTKVKAGAEVTIRAGKAVVFGNGFEVGQQARVAVGGSPAQPAAATPEGKRRDG